MDALGDLTAGGILAFLVIKEAFALIAKMRSGSAEPPKAHPDVSAITDRLDRMLDLQREAGGDIRSATKATADLRAATEDLGRQIDLLDATVRRETMSRRQTGPQPLMSEP